MRDIIARDSDREGTSAEVAIMMYGFRHHRQPGKGRKIPSFIASNRHFFMTLFYGIRAGFHIKSLKMRISGEG
jgi:hypothetical protein